MRPPVEELYSHQTEPITFSEVANGNLRQEQDQHQAPDQQQSAEDVLQKVERERPEGAVSL